MYSDVSPEFGVVPLAVCVKIAAFAKFLSGDGISVIYWLPLAFNAILEPYDNRLIIAFVPRTLDLY